MRRNSQTGEESQTGINWGEKLVLEEKSDLEEQSGWKEKSDLEEQSGWKEKSDLEGKSLRKFRLVET